MRTENWINGMDVLFLSKKDSDYWDKLCKEVEDGKVPYITLRGVKYDLVRHGKWEVHEAFGYMDMTCSVCGWLYEYYFGLEEEWNFCPHCGAKMNEVTE